MDKKDLRPINIHTYPFRLCSTGQPIILRVSDGQKIDTEIFAHLEYLSEIQENGIKRLREIKKVNGKAKHWKTFRSFVRQSKLFYFSAKMQDPSISSLNYFYAFENLVKAYCCLYFPNKVNNKISHGLSTGTVFSDDFNQEITIKKDKDGVMPLFYKLITGEKVKKERKIINKILVPYCTDVSYENDLANIGFGRKSLFMKASIGGESQEKVSLIIAINAPITTLQKYPKLANILESHFNLVDIEQRTADEALKIPLNEYRAYTFFQSKDDFKLVPTELVSKDFHNKFFPFVSFYPRNMQEGFKLNLPTEDINNKEIIINECIAIFILMFYMSELVRYHPKTIQDNLSKPAGWLMERFTVNTPQTFLRYMVNLIRGQDFIFD